MIEKLSRHLATAPKSESDVVYMLVQVRKLLEQAGESDLPRLKFFCDWVLHPGLAGKEAGRVLLELDDRLSKHDSSQPWEIDPDGRVAEMLSFRRFRYELAEYLTQLGVAADWMQDYSAWPKVQRLYSEIVRDCPLSITRKDHPFTYLAKIEITACEPSPAVVTANPHMDAFGWNWRFTLDDGKTFEMCHTSLVA